LRLRSATLFYDSCVSVCSVPTSVPAPVLIFNDSIYGGCRSSGLPRSPAPIFDDVDIGNHRTSAVTFAFLQHALHSLFYRVLFDLGGFHLKKLDSGTLTENLSQIKVINFLQDGLPVHLRFASVYG